MTEKEERVEWDAALRACQDGELELQYDNGRTVRGHIHSVIPRRHQLTFYFTWVADKKGKKWKRRTVQGRKPLRFRIDGIELIRLKDGRYRFRYEPTTRRADKRTCYLIPPNSKLLLDENSF